MVTCWNLTSFVFKNMLSTHVVGEKGEWCDYPLFPEVAQADITAEEQERREQSAYYQGWQDGKQYYLEEFGGYDNG